MDEIRQVESDMKFLKTRLEDDEKNKKKLAQPMKDVETKISDFKLRVYSKRVQGIRNDPSVLSSQLRQTQYLLDHTHGCSYEKHTIAIKFYFY